MSEGGLALGSHGLVAGWAGQSGVLAPCDVAVVVALGLRRYFPSTSDLGV